MEPPVKATDDQKVFGELKYKPVLDGIEALRIASTHGTGRLTRDAESKPITLIDDASGKG